MVQLCFDLCEQDVWFDWFVYVVVCVEFEVEQFVEWFVVCGYYDDYVVVLFVCFVVDFEVVFVWQVYVEDDEIGMNGQDCWYCGVIMQYSVDFIVVFVQVVGDQCGQVGVVFDEQDVKRYGQWLDYWGSCGGVG